MQLFWERRLSTWRRSASDNCTSCHARPGVCRGCLWTPLGGPMKLLYLGVHPQCSVNSVVM